MFQRKILAVALAAAITAPFAGAIEVYPAKIQIDRQNDVQRVVIMDEREDGVTVDLTLTAEVRFEPEGIARRDETGRVHAVANGETTMYVKNGEEEVAVPVSVANADVTPPISFPARRPTRSHESRLQHRFVSRQRPAAKTDSNSRSSATTRRTITPA
jgi:hypothetical protein